jgi:ABC-type multidrug transport system fused ATPase/permease subunit
MRRRGVLLARLVANGVAQSGAAVATLLVVRFAYDRLLGSHAEPAPVALLVSLGAALLTLAASTAVLRVFERSDAEALGQHYAYRVRRRIFDRLASLTLPSLQLRTRGALMLRFVGDIRALRQWVSLGQARLIVASITTCCGLGALAWINPVLGATVAIALAAGATTALLTGGPLQRAVRTARRENARLAANVNEKIAAMPVVQAFGQSRRERKLLGRQGRRLRDAMIARARVAGWLQTVPEITAACVMACVLILGSREVAAGRASHGLVVAALTVVHFLVAPIRDLGRVFEYWQSARLSLQKIGEFLRSGEPVEEAADAPRLAPGPGALDLRAVSLGGVFADVSAHVEPGTRVALVGANGSGKSTLLALIARLLDPEEGSVEIDGQDIRACKLESVRRAVGMVSPDLPLLRGTIESNVRYRWPRASADAVAEIVALCGVDRIAAELDEGLGARITEGGLNLSVGQRQRIALARAMLGAPRLLLLDEADANLDAESRQVLERLLARHAGTVILVTHRDEMIAAADRVWRLENGALREQRLAVAS